MNEEKSISKEWRMHAFLDALPILNEPVKHVASNVSDKEAFEDIIQTLKRQSEKVTLLFTGPLTDLAKALQKDSSIVQYIEKLVWMGGTFYQKEMLKNLSMMVLQNGMHIGIQKRLKLF